ncbi:MAG: DUF928 domain-containing protein [Cyanobacteria bacterium J06621_11]
MKHKWFAGTLGAVALVLGTAWTQGNRVYAIGFEPPAENSAPREGSGGASRGSFFTPASDNAAPREATGGASRGGFFTPAPDNNAPSESTGGASRGDFFTPAPDNNAPSESAGGASRGDFFTPAPDNDMPSETTGGMSGGSRGNTYGVTDAATVASMLAVTPDSFYGTTLEARPTILVYVPASNASEAVFSLKTEDKDFVYQMMVAVPRGGGVVAVTLPAEAPELAVDQNYQWYLAMMLDNELSPASPFVDGWVKRISPSTELASRLELGEGLADVAQLGANGIWYDTVAQLARLNEAEASDEMAGHWYELLESVGLAEIAAAPVVL